MIDGVRLEFDDNGNAKAIVPEKNTDTLCLHERKCKKLIIDDETGTKLCMAEEIKTGIKPIYDIMREDRRCPKNKWWVVKWNTFAKSG